jgi:hypothetical protein
MYFYSKILVVIIMISDHYRTYRLCSTTKWGREGELVPHFIYTYTYASNSSLHAYLRTRSCTMRYASQLDFMALIHTQFSWYEDNRRSKKMSLSR